MIYFLEYIHPFMNHYLVHYLPIQSQIFALKHASYSLYALQENIYLLLCIIKGE